MAFNRETEKVVRQVAKQQRAIGKMAAEIMRHCIATYEARGVVLNQADMQMIADVSWNKARELC